MVYEKRVFEIGRRIKSERIRYKETHGKKLSQEQLLWMLDLSESSTPYLRKWEKGEAMPSLKQLCQMSEIFGCDVGYLLADYDQRTRDAADVCHITGLSERAVARLEGIKKDPVSGFAKNSDGGTYIVSARRTINELLESEHLDRLLYRLGEFLIFSGSTAEPVEQDDDFSVEDDGYRRTINFVRSQGSEIVKRSKIAEMYLLTAADEFKEIFREIAEEQTGGKRNAKKK